MDDTGTTSKRERILVADPDPRERHRLAEIARSAAVALGREVVIDQAADGNAALTMWTQNTPSLVLCEVLLDGLSGLALLRRMKAERAKVPPVIFVTRMARESDRYWGLRNGAHAYLPRPYEDQELYRRVEDVLVKGPDAAPQHLLD